jgi:hypothetical protein
MRLPTDQYFEKHLLFHFGLLILAIILLAVVCFFLWKQISLQSNVDDSLQTQIINLQNQALKQQKVGSTIRDIAINDIDNASTADWKTYKNEEYGFEIKYLGEVLPYSNDLATYLSIPGKVSGTGGDNVMVQVKKQLSVSLPGTVGSVQYSDSQVPDSRVFSEKNGEFTKDYFFEYGGMGGWDVVINAYQYRKGNYYIVSFQRGGFLGRPGDVEPSGKKITKDDIIKPVLDHMLNSPDESIEIFNQMLSTFKFTK